ncbi:hypothetical protein BVU17_03170 [Haloarcula taiwanensis]|uniref:DUF8151 domain-containing protein n=1 Tax=Haloarcula taiwanensis TaxID=1932004 RepID=A0A2H4ZVR9_9EURY|nr:MULTISPECIES: hypothetical protein [Haloarcula]AUG46568.1 hypothetical protein BVU17_03170 [Haloarcula taiwanensis]RLM36768.1 hypothetical protein DVK01_09120 [Haloarcula sp. Atlit-120R]RLM44841.1 hypothetical protein DVK00_10330 [Haloarcula sp. Atlit-47R]RLN01730.1 hypothetical protein D3D01_02615 [Haloarcula sp. Atlit-7R]
MATESIPELLELLLSTVLAVGLTVGGALTEQAALADLSGGISAFAAWEVYMGLVLLYAGYLLTSRRVLPAFGSA